MTPAVINLAGGIFNAVAATVVLYVAIRNFMIHKENCSLIVKLDMVMGEMAKLRDLLDEDPFDPPTGGDAPKEVSH